MKACILYETRNTFIQLTSQAKRKAEEAGKSVQASLSKSALDEFTFAGKSTWGDITKSAKKGLLKVNCKSLAL